MVLSYSAIAKPTADTPSVISIASPSITTPQDVTPTAGPSTRLPGINHLILDAGPLLSLAPLRHLAQTFHTTPMVLAELRDPKARQHWENLGISGVDVRVERPSADAMAKVVAFAKKTGDIAVLSATDLSVIALTYQWEVAENGEKNIRTELGQTRRPVQSALAEEKQGKGEPVEESASGVAQHADGVTDEDEETDSEEDEVEEGHSLAEVEEITRSIDQVLLDGQPSQPDLAAPEEPRPSIPAPTASPHQQGATTSNETQIEEDSESDGGEWITPSNVAKHRSHDLGLLPTESGSDGTGPIAAACMTGDFAVQNVLLGMGLGLVGEGGKRINKVKSFVLRCHACFKICKDSSKRFCPSCGNPTLLRTTVTVSAKTGEQRIHLKKNFQYHLRGSKFSIPDAKPGRAKGQLKGGTGLIMREDQAEWQNAVKSQNIKREKQERKAAKGTLDGWDDPDWMPEILSVGMSGKGRSDGRGMPTIGHGRKNPNQARRKR